MDKNTRRHWGPVLILTVLEDYWVCSETDNEPMMILGSQHSKSEYSFPMEMQCGSQIR